METEQQTTLTGTYFATRAAESASLYGEDPATTYTDPQQSVITVLGESAVTGYRVNGPKIGTTDYYQIPGVRTLEQCATRAVSQTDTVAGRSSSTPRTISIIIP